MIICFKSQGNMTRICFSVYISVGNLMLTTESYVCERFLCLQILRLLVGKVLIGHAIHNDCKVLNYSHPAVLTRDTSKIPLLNTKAGLAVTECASLKRLTKLIFNRDIQVHFMEQIFLSKNNICTFSLPKHHSSTKSELAGWVMFHEFTPLQRIVMEIQHLGIMYEHVSRLI